MAVPADWRLVFGHPSPQNGGHFPQNGGFFYGKLTFLSNMEMLQGTFN